MNDKEMIYIREFIKHNNIHQTIESLMFGTHLISILLILIYLRFAISPPDKADPIALYISLCIPVMLLVISILLRKRIFYLKEKEFGKSLYIVQITIYILFDYRHIICHACCTMRIWCEKSSKCNRIYYFGCWCYCCEYICPCKTKYKERALFA